MTLKDSEICKCGLFFSEFHNKDQIRENVTRYLLSLKLPAKIKGLPDDIDQEESVEKRGLCKLKKRNILVKADRNKHGDLDSSFFGVPWHKLDTENVALKMGHIMRVPRGLNGMCEYVLTHAEVKGIFRKAGSAEKQELIKKVMETSGKLVGADLDVIDVAAVIKYFLRKLPTPLIPVEYHNLFLACEEHADKRDVLVLSCLLLPVKNLNLLTYLLEFFDKVASHSSVNQMDAYNIAVCVGPNIMPVYKQEYIKTVVSIVEILIENSDLLGTVPQMMKELPMTRKKTICQKIFEVILPKVNKSR